MKIKKYEISKNNHRSGIHLIPLFYSNYFIQESIFTFSESCIYDLNNSHQDQINKLVGFSIGLHHTNSFRIGWRAVGNEIELLLYYYINRVRKWDVMLKVEPGDSIRNSFLYTDNHVYLNLYKKGALKFIRKIESVNGWCGYTLYPYFGGEIVAPHDMYLHMGIKNKNVDSVKINEDNTFDNTFEYSF